MKARRRGRFDNRGLGQVAQVRGKGGTYQPAHKEERRTQKTGWDEMAPWYAGWAGGGSNFHKHYAIPEILKVAGLKGGMRVVDLGCGIGALREHVERAGAVYVGVDKSPSMIREAKKTAGKSRFYVSDVAKLGGVAIPEKEKFDRAVCMFSIQDVDNHREAIKNAAHLLKPKGELVLFMVHPAFRIPRQSGWGKDAARKLTFRRVDRYKTEITIPLPQRAGREQVTSFFYHRPIGSYMSALKDAGFLIQDLKEVYSSTKGFESEFPHFLLINATKP